MIDTLDNTVTYTVTDPDRTEYAFPCRLFSADDVRCFSYDGDLETELVRGTDFSVSLADEAAGGTVSGSTVTGGTVTILVPLAAGTKLSIVREIALSQIVSLPEYGKIPSAALNRQLDRIVMFCQQLKDALVRSFAVPHGMIEFRDQDIYNKFAALARNIEPALAASSSAAAARDTAVAASSSAAAARDTAVGARDTAVAARDTAENARIDIQRIIDEADLNRVSLQLGDWSADSSAYLAYDAWTPLSSSTTTPT